MKSTGIVRRIDDLGRIVIPKEIRKTLKIKENESLEVFINNEEIILKKFSNMNDMEKTFDNYVSVLKDITGNSVIITDREKIVACPDNKKDELLKKEISEYLDDMLNIRNPILSNDMRGINLIEDLVINNNYYIIPMLVNSDVVGLLIMLSNKEITDSDKMSLEIASKILINCIE